MRKLNAFLFSLLYAIATSMWIIDSTVAMSIGLVVIVFAWLTYKLFIKPSKTWRYIWALPSLVVCLMAMDSVGFDKTKSAGMAYGLVWIFYFMFTFFATKKEKRLFGSNNPIND